MLVSASKDNIPRVMSETSQRRAQCFTTGMISAVTRRNEMLIRDHARICCETASHLAGDLSAIHVPDNLHVITTAQNELSGPRPLIACDLGDLAINAVHCHPIQRRAIDILNNHAQLALFPTMQRGAVEIAAVLFHAPQSDGCDHEVDRRPRRLRRRRGRRGSRCGRRCRNTGRHSHSVSRASGIHQLCIDPPLLAR